MRLLVLSPVFPDAPSDGDRVRLYHWLKALGARHELHLLCFSDPARAADAGPSRLGKALASVQRVPLGRWRRRLSAGLRLLSPLPVSVSSAQSAAMRAAVDAAIVGAQAQGRPFDALLCYRLKMAPYALRFRGPRVLDYTDSLTRYAERRAVALRLDGRALASAWWRRQARRSAAFEIACAAQFDAGFFNSQQDCQALRAMAPAQAWRLQVAANGVEQGRPRSARPRPGALTVAFVGHLAYAPNGEAVRWFAQRVLPRLRAAEPGVEFLVIGGDAPPALRALQGLPGLRFTGAVADVQAALAQARVSVCPVHSGAGRQNKLLDAFAAGLPSVATRFSAEGVEARDGRELLVADGPQAFADAVLRLLRQPALGRRLAGNARALLRKRYRWPSNAAVLARALAGAKRDALW